MTVVEATVHGAVSMVNAIATGKGATIGIDTYVKTRLETSDGTGTVSYTHLTLPTKRIV